VQDVKIKDMATHSLANSKVVVPAMTDPHVGQAMPMNMPMTSPMGPSYQLASISNDDGVLGVGDPDESMEND
jgi:hypothetical protein